MCVQCNFLDIDSSECIVAVVHDRDLKNIESSHKFTRSGDTASGCIEGVNLEDYHVGVVRGRRMKSGMFSMFFVEVCKLQLPLYCYWFA